MIRAVIFDMFETLITHYESPLYFGAEMAEDAVYLSYEQGVAKPDKEIFLRCMKEGSTQPVYKMAEFEQVETPLGVVRYLIK